MDIISLQKVLEELGEPAFRFKQIKRAYFSGSAGSWADITTLSISLREELSKKISFDAIKKNDILSGKDKRTFKGSFILPDGKIIESVLMVYDGRITACLSSQAGCNLKCQFCATGQGGFYRNLFPHEIYEQIVLWDRFLKHRGKVSGVVFMGMGEPLQNWENVWSAIGVINDKECLNIGQRHISISTAGIVPGIKKFTALDTQINLAISLNASNGHLRSRLMPINKKYGLDELLKACKEYVKKTKRKLFFEYVMIKDVNDSLENARELAALLKGEKLFHLNIIPYNAAGGSFLPSPRFQISKFHEYLLKEGIRATVRNSFGREIKGACGQLSGKNTSPR